MVSDVGAGSVLALAVVGVVVSLALSTVALGNGLLARQRTIAAADAAALGAADVLLGAAPGLPCETAELIASVNKTALTSCDLDGYVVTVTVRSAAFGVPITASATAGPPFAR